MARLLFGGDDVSMRGPYGSAQLNASGRTGIVYADATTSALADIVTYPGGAAIAGSVITVTADSQLPLFQGPADGSDTVWVSVDGGTRTPIYTNVDARLDLLNTVVGTKAATTYVDAQDAATLSSAQTFATGAVGTETSRAMTAEATKLVAGSTATYANLAALPAASAHTNEIVKTLDAAVYESTGSAWVQLVPPTGTYAAPSGSPATGDSLVWNGAAWAVDHTTYHLSSGAPLNALSPAVGCQGDGKYSSSGSITSGTTTLTGPSFATTEVGKKITVVGAGVAGANLYTTIASRNGPASVELTDAASTTVSGARTAWGTDDSAAIQTALGLGASILFGDRTFYLHNTGVEVTGRKRFYGVGKNFTFGGGGSGNGTCFLYTGSDAGLRLNTETGTAATTDANMGDFSVDCVSTGAVGIRIGRVTGSPKSVTGRIMNVRASGAVTSGWDLVAAQLLSFYDCEGSANVGDGWVYNDTAPGSNAALTFVRCRGENNTGRGQFIKSAASVGHYGCIFQSNGLEGTYVSRSAANPVLTDITWDGKCYWEVNNSGRAGTGWAQVKIESLGSGQATRMVFNDPYMVSPGAGNFHIDLQKGELFLRFPAYNGTTPAVNVSNSTVSKLVVYGQNDPVTNYTVGANAPCVWMRTDTGVFTYYTNVAGTPTPSAVFPDEVVQALGNSGAAKTISPTTGTYVTTTLTANCTFTFTAPTSGVAHSFTLELTQDGTGGRTVTWPASVKWPSGSAPSISTAVGAVDLLSFVSHDGGTTWYGALVGTGFA